MTASGIGSLTVLAELGAGAGSRVFHVRRCADASEYALKVVSAGRRADHRYCEQLRHEYRVGRLLDHPNLAKVYALEVRRDWLFRPKAVRLLVEFVPGRALDRLPTLPIGCAVRVFAETAAALEHMHDRGVLHADIKPGNLIYDPARGVKLIDFGLAQVAGERSARFQGTPAYMAPETAAHRIVTERTDIYNLGATMYHVITRRVPPALALGGFPGTRTRPAPLTPVASLNPDAPPELCDLIERCLSFDPNLRPNNTADVRAVAKRLARRR